MTWCIGGTCNLDWWGSDLGLGGVWMVKLRSWSVGYHTIKCKKALFYWNLVCKPVSFIFRLQPGYNPHRPQTQSRTTTTAAAAKITTKLFCPTPTKVWLISARTSGNVTRWDTLQRSASLRLLIHFCSAMKRNFRRMCQKHVVRNNF